MVMILKYLGLTTKESIILTAHAFVGWALCGAVMGIGRAVTTVENAVNIHAIAAPIIFGLISIFYFKKFNFTNPLQTAAYFVSFTILMDFFVVAPFIENSFDMFVSLIGTWIPFALIFVSTYITGNYMKK